MLRKYICTYIGVRTHIQTYARTYSHTIMRLLNTHTYRLVDPILKAYQEQQHTMVEKGTIQKYECACARTRTWEFHRIVCPRVYVCIHA